MLGSNLSEPLGVGMAQAGVGIKQHANPKIERNCISNGSAAAVCVHRCNQLRQPSRAEALVLVAALPVV